LAERGVCVGTDEEVCGGSAARISASVRPSSRICSPYPAQSPARWAFMAAR